MMKSSVTTLLVGVLGLSVLASMLLCAWCVRTSGRVQMLQSESQRLQGMLYVANHNRTVVQSMVNDAVEYSRQDASILPLLNQFNIKPQGGSPAATQPSKR